MTNEFQFLETDARRVHRLAPLPQVKRVNITAPSGRTMSALTYFDLSARNEATTVFLHGAGLNAHTFDPTVLALQENAVSIDLPGHGKSDWRDDANYSPEAIAEDVAATIEQLVEGDFHIVGQSLGGLVAAALATRTTLAPLTCSIIDITPGVIPQKDSGQVSKFISGKRKFSSIEEMVDRAIEFDIGSDRDALTRGVTLNTHRRDDGWFEWSHHFAHLDDLAQTESEDGSEAPYAALWEPLSMLGSKVTLIRGTEGMVTATLQEEWNGKLPDAKVITIVGGHNLQEHAPKQLGHCLQILNKA